MKTLRLTAFTLVLCLAAIITSNAQTSQVIVKLKNAAARSVITPNVTGNNAIDNISRKYGATRVTAHRMGMKTNNYFYVIRFPKGSDIPAIVNAYTATGQVEYAEPDYIGTIAGVEGQKVVPNDSFFHKQWDMHNDGSFNVYPCKAGVDIDMEDAWTLSQGDSSIVVAIIDAGLRLGHPEFAGRIWHNYAEIPGNGIDDDQNDFVDDYTGWNFAYENNDPTDDQSHGTNVTGILGASGNNNIGYAGMDWNCKLMIVKAIDSTGTGQTSWWTDGVYYAVDKGARVISMSLVGGEFTYAMQDAINYALSSNVVIVAAEGNLNTDAPQYPAAYTGVIAVGATDAVDHRVVHFYWDTVSSGSSYGNNLSVMAPGSYIYGLSNKSDTDYTQFGGGTSQATPHVSGLAALILAKEPQLTPAEVKSIIETTAIDKVGDPAEDTTGYDKYYGHGRINAYHALALAMGVTISSITETKEQVGVYPNPSANNFTVQIPPGAREIRILNSLGSVIKTEEVTGQLYKNFQLNASGMYLVQVVTGMETLTGKLLICN